MRTNIPKTLYPVPTYTPSTTPPIEKLTPTELRIWYLIRQGLTFPQIARSLAVSINTIGFHRRKLYSKLNCHSKSDIINLYHKTFLSSNDQSSSP